MEEAGFELLVPLATEATSERLHREICSGPRARYWLLPFGAHHRVCGDGSSSHLIEEVRFASNSPVAENGFETSVPSSPNAMSALWRVSRRRRTCCEANRGLKTNLWYG